LNNPWPIEVYGRDGKAHNVTMMPGDMVLYESHTTLHGRPTHLDGKFFANVFVHFEPVDENGQRKNGESRHLNAHPTSYVFELFFLFSFFCYNDIIIMCCTLFFSRGIE
jgi:hypothetical protein